MGNFIYFLRQLPPFLPSLYIIKCEHIFICLVDFYSRPSQQEALVDHSRVKFTFLLYYINNMLGSPVSVAYLGFLFSHPIFPKTSNANDCVSPFMAGKRNKWEFIIITVDIYF